jgi:ssDNA-binding replication factor A large subunit
MPSHLLRFIIISLDLIVIVITADEVTEIIGKKGNTLKKRSITLADETGIIVLSIWNEMAESWSINGIELLLLATF